MSSPDRRSHIGPETTSTYWMSRTANLLQTIMESPMVSMVSGYIAAMAAEEAFSEDEVDPEEAEEYTMRRLDYLLESEAQAYDEYMKILDSWSIDDDHFMKAARLAMMITEANYLSINSIPDRDEDMIYATECAYEYAKMVKLTVAMLEKTRRWAKLQESRKDSGEDNENTG